MTTPIIFTVVATQRQSNQMTRSTIVSSHDDAATSETTLAADGAAEERAEHFGPG